MQVPDKLASERQRLLGLLADLPESDTRPRDLSSADQHPADKGTEVFDQEERLSVRLSIEGELAAVDHAMQRVEDGSYGICEMCGQPIDADRLAALPTARLCVRDQQRVDLEGGSAEVTGRDRLTG
jgi:RNA polymerase-binding transcription factor DksA